MPHLQCSQTPAKSGTNLPLEPFKKKAKIKTKGNNFTTSPSEIGATESNQDEGISFREVIKTRQSVEFSSFSADSFSLKNFFKASLEIPTN
jgi:hypothetical protein